MKTKQNAALMVEQVLARDRTEAHRDAQAFVIEFAGGVPSGCFDPMRAGVVLRPGETAYRQVPIWIRVQQDATKPQVTPAPLALHTFGLMRLNPVKPAPRSDKIAQNQLDQVQRIGGNTMSEPWLSADDIAAHLGVTKDTVYAWIAEKQMPAHKVGRLWRFQASEVDEWVRGGGTAGSGEPELPD